MLHQKSQAILPAGSILTDIADVFNIPFPGSGFLPVAVIPKTCPFDIKHLFPVS